MIGVTKFRLGKLKQKHDAQVDEKYLWDSLRPIIPYPTGRAGRHFATASNYSFQQHGTRSNSKHQDRAKIANAAVPYLSREFDEEREAASRSP
jgi:hypothetical protein